MDSATAAYEARNRGYEVYALHTSYGQRTEDRELACAREIASAVGAQDFLQVETGHLAAIGASSLTDDEVAVEDAPTLEAGEGGGEGALQGGVGDGSAPAGDPDADDAEIPTTYVPFRNANLLSMAVSYAEANECSAVFIGAHAEDFAGYPDCRPTFFEAFEAVVDVGTRPETDIAIEAPFVEVSKTDIAARGIDLAVPFEHTWSCYRASAPACGTCDSCARRLEAFQRVGVCDPIAYAERPRYAGESDDSPDSNETGESDAP